MHDDSTRPDSIAPLTDPGTLADREDVAFDDPPAAVHQNHYEGYRDIAGMGVVGVVDAEDRLLVLQHDEAPHPVLPYAEVDHDEDYVAAGRAEVRSETGLDVAIDAVERVRRNTYRAEDGDGETTGHDVVLAASPRDGETTTGDPDGEWTAEWIDGVDVAPEYDDSDVVEDVRLFLD